MRDSDLCSTIKRNNKLEADFLLNRKQIKSIFCSTFGDPNLQSCLSYHIKSYNIKSYHIISYQEILDPNISYHMISHDII